LSPFGSPSLALSLTKSPSATTTSTHCASAFTKTAALPITLRSMLTLASLSVREVR
jgi:hypothetical protein